ncbi:MAG TPA: type II toxin-antitoxin system Phd/YefM family antitoxin [Phycisphaerae bacterium]|jgi:antitoxin (DNA-binding transcriptional repressor) of toxin-antitoxin stability system|nr:type II toxin-antitoxin system Phd/YefM family antitoxin [Phycisphaerae bacterium]HVX83428.1 type II toxin-antitoxin system Phd/YefM family antitoxin [Phycisphaerae bacterium]
MKSVGVYEAKTHLPKLLQKLLASNESIQITRHGVPIARIVPEKAFEGDRESIATALAAWKSTRKNIRLKGLTIKQLREEGRR